MSDLIAFTNRVKIGSVQLGLRIALWGKLSRGLLDDLLFIDSYKSFCSTTCRYSAQTSTAFAAALEYYQHSAERPECEQDLGPKNYKAW